MTSDPKVVHKYTAGYSQCATEVTRYLSKMDGFNPEIKNRLVNHLSNCVNKIHDTVPAPGPSLQLPGFPAGQQPIGLQMAGGGIVIPQSQAMDLKVSNLASAVISSMASASSQGASSAPPVVIPSSSGFTLQQPPAPPSQGLFTNPSAAAGSAQQQQVQHQQLVQQVQQAQVQQAAQQQTPQAQSSQQPQAAAATQGVPVLPVQLIPAKLPTGDLVFLMTNQSMPAMTNVVAPMSIQIPGVNPGPDTQSPAASIISPTPATQVTPTMQNMPTAMGTASIPLATAPTAPVSIPSTSVAVVNPQIQEPKPSSSTGPEPQPAHSNSDLFKSRPIFPLFDPFDPDKPLDLGPSSSGLSAPTSGFNLKLPSQSSSGLNFGARPKTAPSATVTSSSSIADEKEELDKDKMTDDGSRRTSSGSDTSYASTSSREAQPGPSGIEQQQESIQQQHELQRQYHASLLLQQHVQQPHIDQHAQAAAQAHAQAQQLHQAFQGQGNILNLPHLQDRNFFRPW